MTDTAEGRMRERLTEIANDLIQRGFDTDIAAIHEFHKRALAALPAPQAAAPSVRAPDELTDAIQRKTKEIEDGGLCKWKYACPYCLAGFVPMRSSVSEAMVHPDAPVGRIICEGRDKPTALFPERAALPGAEAGREGRKATIRNNAENALTINYDEDGRWRVDYKNGKLQTIGLPNNAPAQSARAQIRGMLVDFALAALSAAETGKQIKETK